MITYDPARILCVEADCGQLLALKTGLELYGFEVIAVSDGTEALAQYWADDGNYDAIVIDHSVDGLKFVQAVRERGFKGQIIIIDALTVEDLRGYQAHHISGFFQKPISPSLLATLLLQG